MRPGELRARGFRGLRIIPDVHGEAVAFRHAIEGAQAQGLFVVQLGDLTDYGPDSPGCLRLAFALRDAGSGLFLLGNHDHKLRRALRGADVRSPPDALPLTLAQLGEATDGEALAARAIAEIAQAPAWWRCGPLLCVHAAYHPAMIEEPPPPEAGARPPGPVVSRAIFGQVTGRSQHDGFPERLVGWTERVPRGLSVIVGHDRRSTDGRPLVVTSRAGGQTTFLDLGAGKGGHLGWLDLDLPGG